MQYLINKKVLLGITGGIAAYKAAELVRLLIKAGAEVRVVMTPSAQEFVQPLTYQALSGHRVYTEVFDGEADSAMDHIELARWCDLMMVAPASADFIGKLVSGHADNLLLTLALACDKPLAVAPAMNQQMWANAATADNINALHQRGLLVWGPDAGEQACGEVGPGRMLEPTDLANRANSLFQPGRLDGINVLITAGPTREAIDPVRYLSNRSSGKMGYAIADAASRAGATVTLVSGPVCLKPLAGVTQVDVISANDMLDAVMQRVADNELFISCAAVADYRIATPSEQKIKKSDATLSLDLVPNPDILATVSGAEKRPFCVGFAAETTNVADYARAKLQQKNLDMIAANDVSSDSSGFEADLNQLQVFWNGDEQIIPLGAKSAVAEQLIDLVADRYFQTR